MAQNLKCRHDRGFSAIVWTHQNRQPCSRFDNRVPVRHKVDEFNPFDFQPPPKSLTTKPEEALSEDEDDDDGRLSEFIEPVHLQIVCRQLWHNLPEGEVIIVAKDVRDFGDVDQALQNFYEETLTRVSEETRVSQRLLRLWFDQSLITPARTRGLIYRGETATDGMIKISIHWRKFVLFTNI